MNKNIDDGFILKPDDKKFLEFFIKFTVAKTNKDKIKVLKEMQKYIKSVIAELEE